MWKKIYEELIAIRKELQAIRSSLEPRKINTTLNFSNGNANNLVEKTLRKSRVVMQLDDLMVTFFKAIKPSFPSRESVVPSSFL